MGREDNLAIASSAVQYVRSLARLGTRSKRRVVKTLEQPSVCTFASSSVGLAESRILSGMIPPMPRFALKRPAIRRETRPRTVDIDCENCSEQAAVAFMFLKEAGIRPIDFTAYQDPGDHAFVVIGRVAGSDPRNFRTWGDDAVVCDPWAGDVFPVSEIPAKLHVGLKLSLHPWLGDNQFQFDSWFRLD